MVRVAPIDDMAVLPTVLAILKLISAMLSTGNCNHCNDCIVDCRQCIAIVAIFVS